MKNIKSIEISFENFDFIVIPYEYFKEFNEKGGIEFVLKQEVNDAAKAFAGDVHEVAHRGKSLFERLQRSDITEVYVTYEDSSVEKHRVRWFDDGDNGYRNTLQKCEIMPSGDMKVVIGMPGPALFFCAEGMLLFHGCSLAEGEKYGDFLNYPRSHYDVWDERYFEKYGVDFDYFPRGRVVYRKTDDTYLIYYDKCMEADAEEVIRLYEGRNVETGYDEHYQCHMCNSDYVL